jgi:hypothetical protein
MGKEINASKNAVSKLSKELLSKSDNTRSFLKLSDLTLPAMLWKCSFQIGLI